MEGSGASSSWKPANPAPLGLAGFALTTFVLSMINANWVSGADTPVVLGLALAYGGLAQLLAGMWEFPRGNVFGATAFSSYGAFWMSYATILIPSSGIVESYANAPAGELTNAIGIYLVAWFMFTFFMLIGALRKNIAFIALFAFLTATFGALAAGAFLTSTNVTKAGGALGIITAFIAYYCAVSELLVKEDSYFGLPLGHIPKRSL